MEKYTLKNPITINGKKVTELTYDTNEITGELYEVAFSKKSRAAGTTNISISPSVEFDYGLHLYLGFAAIIAINGEIDWSDLERVKGADIMAISKIGRNFTLGVEESELSSSENASETTPESTTPIRHS